MTHRTKLFFILFFLNFHLFASNKDSLYFYFNKANEFYKKSEYNKALIYYKKIEKLNYESPELYYNMGNAYFKIDDIAFAIAYYEKAKKLSPYDEDIDFNLDMAQSKTIDKIEELPSIKILSFFNKIIFILPEKIWGILSILFIILTLCFLYFFIVSPISSRKKTNFALSVFFAFSFLLSFAFGMYEFNYFKTKKEAVIKEASVTVKSSPTANGTSLFVLHKGTKVAILDNNDNWVKVKLANGEQGWISKDDLILI